MALPKFSNVLVAFILLCLIQPFVVRSTALKSGSLFKYLPYLKGTVQKGQTVKGLNEVKQYLKKFGYYSTANVDLSDIFDNNLESALKAYQKNYHLNIKGKLGSDTISKMMIPRCGVPDIINPTKHNHNYKYNFHLVPDYNFFDNKPKWPASKYDLTYTFMDGLQGNNLQIMRGVCSRAFKRWADVSPLSFQEASDGEQANIFIAFYSGDHGDGLPFDGTGNILAHAFPPENGNMHFDADENWSVDPDFTQMDLESVAVHEIGHLLGLAHSDDPNAIMHQGIPPGTIRRDLTQDDIDGIQALYNN